MDRSSLYRQVAALHVSAINQGFLASLGVPFLSIMYQAIDESAAGVLIADVDRDTVRGFVAGGIGMSPIYRRMLRRPLRLGLALLPTLLRPRRLKRIIEIIRYGSRGGGPLDLPQAELLSIAVQPEWRGKGVAEELYACLKKHFYKHDIQSFRIVVGKSLAPAHRYYQKMGAKPVGAMQVHEGESSLVYVQETGAP